MMDQLHQDLDEKEVALAKLRVVLQETKEENKPSITIGEFNTMTNKNTLEIQPFLHRLELNTLSLNSIISFKFVIS
jgi:exonuclease III